MLIHTDSHEIAINAAGIADAFRVARSADHDGESRFQSIADAAGGFIGIAEAFSYAGATMERFRIKVGDESDWGDDLPHVYLAWGAIAFALWLHWEDGPPELVAERALIHLVMNREDEEDEDANDLRL